jgi:hypothetical protein
MTGVQRRELEKQVYELVPVTKEETTCKKEKKKRDYLRAEYRKMIKEQWVGKKEYGELF